MGGEIANSLQFGPQRARQNRPALPGLRRVPCRGAGAADRRKNDAAKLPSACAAVSTLRTGRARARGTVCVTYARTRSGPNAAASPATAPATATEETIAILKK